MGIADQKELKMLEKAADEFARKSLAALRDENDGHPFGQLDTAALEAAYDLGFFHSLLPESAGGAGQGMQAFCLLLDAVSRTDATVAAALFVQAAAHEIMLASGTFEPLAAIAASETLQDFLIAFPVFNDPDEIRDWASAAKCEGRYFLSGDIAHVVLGNIAQRGIVPALLPGGAAYSFFLINLSDPGVVKSDPLNTLGLRGCPAVDIRLSNVSAEIIGEPGNGKPYFDAMADRLHVAAAAISLGIMKGTFKAALAYCRGREQGGRKIVDWSQVRMMLADMAVAIETADLAVAGASAAVDCKASGWRRKSIATAVYVHQAAGTVTTDGIQVLGGVGYMQDFGQEKRFRDAQHVQSLLGLAPLKRLRCFDMIKNID